MTNEEVIGLIDDRYQVLGILGEGASALVLDVLDRGRERRALKVLLEGADERLLRGEFGRLSRLDHPNLVRVHDLGRLETAFPMGARLLPRGALYLVLDRVDGVTPTEALAKAPEGERDARLRVLADDLAAALEHLHGHGLLHHDVKPANVLVAKGRAILIDLGLAARARADGRARGTLAYMAPEALAGGGDSRVDLYGLGATLFELAVDRPPFAGQGATLVRAILEQPAPLPTVGWLRQPTAQLIQRLLAKDPAHRPISTRSIRAELARLRDDHEAVARISGALELLPPTFCGRSEALAALAPALAGISDERVQIVLGEPGSGKTRLIQEALRRHRILFAAGRARAIEVFEGDPRELLAEHERSGLVGLDDIAVAIGDRLEQRGRRRPQVLLLGHLDADPLARRLAQVLSAVETGEAVIALGELDRGPIDALELGGATRAIELGPLDLAAVSTIAASMTGTAPSAEIVERLHRLAAGNSALVLELVRLWVRRGGAGLEDLGGEDALVGLLGRQRESRGESAKLVDALAVWGEPLTLDELAALVDRGADELWPTLLELTREGLLAVEGGLVCLPSQGHYAAWAAALPMAERRQLLLKAAGAPKAAADPVKRAELLAGAADPVDPLATPYRELQRAAVLLEQRHEVPRALALLEAARRVADHAGQHELAPRLAELYVRTGRYDQALSLLDGARGETALLRVEALQRRGDYDEARRELEETLGELDGKALARARALLGRLLLRRGELRAVLDTCGTAAEAVRQTAPGESLGVEQAGLIEVVALAHFYLGELETADALLRWAEERLRGGAHSALYARFRSMLGMVAFSEGRLQEAAECYQDALRGAERAGDAHAVATYVGNLGSARLELGEYQEALTHLTRAVRDLSRLARNTELASVLHNLGGLMLLLGDLGRVEELHQRAAQLAKQLGSRHVEGFVEWLAGDLARRRLEPTAALECLERAYRAFREVDAGREALGARIASVEALLALGRRERALQLLDELQAQEHEQGGELSLARARVLVSDRSAEPADVQRTTEALAAHCAQLEQRGARSELWRAASVLGRLLAARGRRGAALKALRRARAVREELMSKAPDLYRDALRADPDARSLEAQWKALVEAGPEPSGSELTSSSDSRPGWRPDEHRLRRLLGINKRLNSELRLPNLLEMIVDTVIELTDAERGFLILVEEDGEGEAQLSIKVARNIDRRSLEGEEERSVSRSIAERAARSGEPIVTFDAAEDDRFARLLSVTDLSLRSVLAVPLKVKGRVVGTIYVDHRLRRGAFGEPEVALVQDFADQAAIAIDNARLLAENQARQREIEGLNEQLTSEVATQAEELREVREELRSSQKALGVRYDYGHIIGRTPRMLELFQLLDRVTDTDLPVVVQGESGTGKELVARAIHENGKRAKRPFVSENCGAIPETLLESVLFGAVRGAFTGADRDRRGLFEVADGGTLFLDEVGEMSPGMQTKLLRVLQDGELRRVGGERSLHVDVRLIAASNRDLRELVERGTFREDLFFRLHVVRVELPALRERREDIPILVEHFLRKHSPQPRKITPAVLERLMGYGWPGNVRELENEIMRVAALAGEVIEPADLSPQIGGSTGLSLQDADDLRLKPRVEHLERELIRRALDQTEGNQSQAAKLLGLSRFGLLKKLKRYHPERYES